MATIPLSQMTVAQAAASGQTAAYNALVNQTLSNVPGAPVYTGASSAIPAGGVPSAMSSLTSGGGIPAGGVSSAMGSLTSGGGSASTIPTIASLQNQIVQYAQSPAFTQSHPNYWNNLPYDITQITPTAAAELPSNTGSFGNVAGANASVTGLNTGLDALTKQQQDFQTAELARQDAQNKSNQSLLSKFSSSLTSPDQAKTNAQAQTGIDPVQYFADEKAKISEIGALTETYNNTVAARDQQIATTQDKYASTNFISNQIAQINRNAAPELARQSANINSKTAVLQALQGNFQEAQTFVNQAVNDAISTNKFNVDMYTEFLQSNNDTFNGLDKIYRDAFQASYDIAKTQYTEQKADKTEVGKLLLANPQAGINIATDSLQDAYAKVQANPQTTGATLGSSAEGYKNIVRDSQGNVIKVQPITGGTAGNGTGGGIKLTPSQLNKGVNNAGLSVTDFTALNPDVKNFYVNSTAADLSELQSYISQVKDGTVTADSVKSKIDSGTASDSVKTYFKNLIDQNAPTASTSSDSGVTWWNPLTWFK